MSEFLRDYSSLPEELLSALVTSQAEYQSSSSCTSDNPYCIFDSTLCPYDGVCGSDCPADGICPSDLYCTFDTDPCGSDCSDSCPDCSDTPKKRSSISVSDITYNSATIRITRNDASTIRLIVREDGGSQSTILDTGNTSIGQPTASHTVTGLSPSTTHAYNLWDDIGGWIGTMYFKTAAAPFTRFNWTYAGLDSNGSLVYGSEKLSGLGVYVTAAEWNDLADLVEDVTGQSVTRVSVGTTISATIVNTMASALGASRVSVGSEITAGFFNRLRSAYNGLG